MHRSVPIAIVTCLTFASAVLRPDVARAEASAPAPLPAEDASMAAAKQHFEAGRVAYNGGDFPAAIREFKAAEALRPSPILAYNIGLSNEKLQRRRVAVRYYRRYLEGAPAAANRGEVEGRIAQLEKEIAAQPQAQPAEQPTDNPPPPNAAQPDPNAPPPTANQGDPYAGQAQPMTSAPPQKRRMYWWVWLLIGVGAAVVITAIVVGVYFGVTANTVYYGQTVPATRLDPSTRGNVLDRNALVPPTQRTPETVPLIQIHF